MEALHFDWEDGGPPISGQETSTETLLKENLKPKEITAFLLRTNSRIATLHLQRWINDYPNEAIMAILPGIVLSDLWQNLSYVENGLKLVSICVVLVGLIAMLIAIYNSLNERRREMAILRSLGASPRVIFLLLVSEAFLLTFLGAIFGIGLLYLSLFVLSPIISSEFGIQLSIQGFSKVEWIYLGIILSLGALFGIIPAIRAYLNTLSDGLTIRL
jgi:putative ABC transport system permease protein